MSGAAAAVTNPLAGDLDHILAHSPGVWEALRGERLFITGGTGFFGKWLLESFTWANDQLDLGAGACVLTRDPESFRRKMPHLADHAALRFHAGDVRDFSFPSGTFSYIIHAATEASATLNAEQPLLMLDTVTEGTKRTLEFARRCGAKRFLLTSSGAVYGRQPAEMTHVPESYTGGPDPLAPGTAYAEGKRYAEALCALYGKAYGFDTVIARCFAFVGPYLPLDLHFAIGNFIRDGMRGEPIKIGGDGTPYRSYLYAADLMIWLWRMLIDAPSGRAFNVGSGESLTIAELANTVAGCFAPAKIAVQIAGKPVQDKPAERYVPSVSRAERELGLQTLIPLNESIQRSILWNRL